MKFTFDDVVKEHLAQEQLGDEYDDEEAFEEDFREELDEELVAAYERNCCTFSEDGQRLAVATLDRILVWSLGDGVRTHELGKRSETEDWFFHRRFAHWLAFTPDHRFLIAEAFFLLNNAGDGYSYLVVFDLRTGEQCLELLPPINKTDFDGEWGVRGKALDASGQRLAFLTDARISEKELEGVFLEVWSIDTRSRLQRITLPESFEAEHLLFLDDEHVLIEAFNRSATLSLRDEALTLQNETSTEMLRVRRRKGTHTLSRERCSALTGIDFSRNDVWQRVAIIETPWDSTGLWLWDKKDNGASVLRIELENQSVQRFAPTTPLTMPLLDITVSPTHIAWLSYAEVTVEEHTANKR